YVDQRYKQATVVFYGYESGPSTKDSTHQRRSSVCGPSVEFDGKMVYHSVCQDHYNCPGRLQLRHLVPICKNILFEHTILGCDTTSALYGLRKGSSLKMLTSDATFRQQADIFHQADAAKNDIAAAGETDLLCLYKGLKDETLDSLRYARFCQKISTGNTQVQPESLPPTSAAAIYHSLRVYHQVQQWRGIALPPEDWGWKEVDGKLQPQRTDQSAAHPSLLELIRCNCKTGCSSRKCSCKRHDLDCTAACGTCRGQSCDNSAPPDLSESD
ncbi:uncharacterized protein LOC125559782, partial [Nematostella vectensis]|uniref:uncharacterized protein LOC125559782 n=1 Tax=Nematostella vectensis TaxID=45351 RepID=UPI00207748A8